MSQHDAATDLVARWLWRGLEAEMKDHAADKFKDQRAPWRDEIIVEAAERAAEVLVRDIDFANALVGRPVADAGAAQP